MRTKVFYLSALIVMTAACWLLATGLFGALNPAWFIVLALAGGLVTLSLLWATRNANTNVWIYMEATDITASATSIANTEPHSF